MRGRGVSATPVLAGIRTDIETALRLYKDRNTVRYDIFRQLFKSLRLGSIFLGRTNEAEFAEFCEGLLSMVLSYILLPNESGTQELNDRVGPLYLLYAFYFLQPASFRFAIKASIAQMEQLQQFLAELKANGHCDAAFVLFRLFRQNSFEIVATNQENNPLHVKTFDNAADINGGIGTVNSTVEKLDGTEFEVLKQEPLLRDIDEVHRQYENLKTQIALGSAFHCVNESPANILDNVYSRFLNKTEPTYAAEMKGNKKSPVKDRRSNLKQFAYGSVVVQSRRRRHGQQNRQEGDISTLSDLLSIEGSKDIPQIQDKQEIPQKEKPKLKVASPKSAAKNRAPKTIVDEALDVAMGGGKKGKIPSKLVATKKKVNASAKKSSNMIKNVTESTTNEAMVEVTPKLQNVTTKRKLPLVAEQSKTRKSRSETKKIKPTRSETKKIKPAVGYEEKEKKKRKSTVDDNNKTAKNSASKRGRQSLAVSLPALDVVANADQELAKIMKSPRKRAKKEIK